MTSAAITLKNVISPKEGLKELIFKVKVARLNCFLITMIALNNSHIKSNVLIIWSNAR